VDLAAHEGAVAARMLARFKALEAAHHPRAVAPPLLRPAFCAAAGAHAGFAAPYCAFAAGADGCA
jgi:hypothetical protein